MRNKLLLVVVIGLLSVVGLLFISSQAQNVEVDELGDGVVMVENVDEIVDFSKWSDGSLGEITEESWQSKIFFPESLKEGRYISTFDKGWPPEYKISVLYPEGEKPLICEQDSEEIEISGLKYCVKILETGASGWVYKEYEFSTRENYKTSYLSFGIKYRNCDTANDPELCQTEQHAFDVNGLAHKIISTSQYSNR